jgi:hypothetical protein
MIAAAARPGSAAAVTADATATRVKPRPTISSRRSREMPPMAKAGRPVSATTSRRNVGLA